MALDPRAAAQFDEMFMTMASQHKDIAGLFKTFFGFLHRKTDVYVVNRDNGNMGFPEGVAEKLVRGGQQPRAPAGTDPIIRVYQVYGTAARRPASAPGLPASDHSADCFPISL